MRLPGIPYDAQAERRGRLTNEGAQIIRRSSKAQAAGVSGAGEMVAGATKDAGNIVSDAMRWAARHDAQTKLAAEKEKNQKIAQWQISASQHRIKTELSKDLLQIREDRDKFIRDREFLRDKEITAARTGLIAASAAIRAEQARASLAVDERLKLEMLDIQSDAAWAKTLTSAATSLAQTAVSVYFQNQNAQQNAKVANNASEYKLAAQTTAKEIEAQTMTNISAPEYAGMDLAEVAESKGFEPQQRYNDDGTVSLTVPTHYVAKEIYEATMAPQREAAMNGVTSNAHGQDLEQKIANVDGQLQLALDQKIFQDQERIAKAEFNVSVQNNTQAGDIQAVAVDVTNAVADGLILKDEGAEIIKTANEQIYVGETFEQIDAATTTAELATVKANVNDSGLARTHISSLRSAIAKKEDQIKGQIAATDYNNISNEALTRMRPPGVIASKDDDYIGRTEAIEQVRSQMLAKGHDIQVANQAANQMYQDYNRRYDEANVQRSNIMQTAAAIQEAGGIAPVPDDMSDSDKLKIIAGNDQIRKQGAKITDDAQFVKLQRDLMGRNGPQAQARARKMDFSDKITDLSVSQITTLQKLASSDPKGPEMMELKITDSLFTNEVKQLFGKGTPNKQQQMEINALHTAVQAAITDYQAQTGVKPTPEEKKKIIAGMFHTQFSTLEKTGIIAGMFPGAAEYQTGKQATLQEMAIDGRMQEIIDNLRQMGQTVTPTSINAMYQYMQKQGLFPYE